MPMTGDERKLGQIAGGFRSMGERNGAGQQRLLEPVKRKIKDVLRQEFTRSVDPSGASWKKTVRGKAALVSRKLPFAFEFAARDGGVVGVGKSKRDLLDAHQHGATFKARQVAANKNFLSFNRKGRLVKESRIFKRNAEVSVVDGRVKVTYSRGDVRAGAYQRFARAHTVRERVLPQRKIVPEGTTLPPLWSGAVEEGVTEGMTKWADGMVK
jgi:hypothetical protein